MLRARGLPCYHTRLVFRPDAGGGVACYKPVEAGDFDGPDRHRHHLDID